MRALISCCDNNSGLFLWDGEWSHLINGHGQSVVHTPRGIVYMSEGLLQVLDDDLKVIHSVGFSLGGHHGADYDPESGHIVVMSASDNTICFVDIDSGNIVDRWEVNPPSSHTNDIFAGDGGFYTSSFTQGIIFTDRNKKREAIFPNQNKPHSIKKRNGELWWCESEERRVKCDDEEVVSYPGFVRGLAWDKGGDILVGVSHHKYNGEGAAGFYYQGEFHNVPQFKTCGPVRNLYSLIVL